MKKLKDFITLLLLFGGLALVSAWLASQSSMEFSGQVKVLDGDSVIVDGQEIRLQGIDAPEATQTCRALDASPYPCGKRAAAHLRRLASGYIRCEGWERDKFDRLLATCSVESVNLNQKMVEDGWAVAFGDYESAEWRARDKKLGLWSGDFQLPADWRRDAKQSSKESWFSRLFN